MRPNTESVRSSPGRAAGGQIRSDVGSGKHVAGSGISQAFEEIANEVGVGEHVDCLAESVEFAGWHDVGDVITVGDDRDGVTVLCVAHDVGPGG